MSASRVFEPEVLFPDSPYDAACIYFGVMAYPEPGAGLPEGPGSDFANALRKCQLWATKKAKGLGFLRHALSDQRYVAPKLREFEGALERGRRRIFRRMAAFDVLGTQLINGVFGATALASKAAREGRGSEAFHLAGDRHIGPVRPELWVKAMPSPQQVLRASPERWSEKFALNFTGPPSDRHQKARDLKRRAFDTSIPVLHMAHGLNEAVHRESGKINGWGDREPFMALLMNAELWIWAAIDAAEKWRAVADLIPGVPFLRTDGMVQLKVSELTHAIPTSSTTVRPELVSRSGRRQHYQASSLGMIPK